MMYEMWKCCFIAAVKKCELCTRRMMSIERSSCKLLQSILIMLRTSAAMYEERELRADIFRDFNITGASGDGRAAKSQYSGSSALHPPRTFVLATVFDTPIFVSFCRELKTIHRVMSASSCCHR